MARPSLDDRFRIAAKLAKAVLKWHSVGWVHQGISSPNVIFFTMKRSGQVDYENPFLQGFDFARPKSDPSIGRSASDIAFNVYRHPERQGLSRRSHTKIHDIYSLGVVLLEIGLWQRAFDIVADRKDMNKTSAMEPHTIRERLLHAAQHRLAHYSGRTFQSAVEVCLTGSIGSEMDDRHDTNLARSFQHLVIDMLSSGVDIRNSSFEGLGIISDS